MSDLFDLANSIENLTKSQNVRGELSEIRSNLKQEKYLPKVVEIEKLFPYLTNEDAKSRKNAALLIGDLERGGFVLKEKVAQVVEALWKAYSSEETLFVKASYLEAMQSMDVESIRELLQNRLMELRNAECEESELKHIRAERHALELLVDTGDERNHFRGIPEGTAVHLIAEESMREAIAEQFGGESKITPTGVRVKASSWNRIQKCRIYREALFPVPMKKGFVLRDDSVGDLVTESKLMPMLGAFFEGENAYHFRLEVRSPLEKDSDGKFLRRMAQALEETAKGQLLNVTGDYEFTLVLLRKRDGALTPYLKLSDNLDQRFSYRKNTEATSMAGVAAAEVIQQLRPYLREGAQVLDPFCGVGTLLIERAKVGTTGDLYGTDTFGHAILGGRENAALAGIDINFINRDFFDFKHDYPFDEILCEFPDLFDKELSEKEQFYQKFFDRALGVLGDHGQIFFLSSDSGLMHKHLRLHPELRLVTEIPFRKKQNIVVVVK